MDAASQPGSAPRPESPSYMPSSPDPRILPLLDDLELRLRPVLGDMPTPAFNALVHDIAALKLRWADEHRGGNLR